MKALLLALLAAYAAPAWADGARLAFADGLARRGLHAQAVREYEAILQEDPAADDARYALAASLEALGRDAEALTLYRDLAGRLAGERQAAARLRLALALRRADPRSDEARRLLEAVATGPATDAVRQASLLNLGLCYADLGRAKDAESVLRRVAADGPCAPQAKAALAALALAQGDADQAWALHREAIAQAPEAGRPAAAAAAFAAAFAAQAWPQAAAFAQAAGQAGLPDAAGRDAAAYAALRAQRPEEARAWLEAAKRAAPAPTPGRLALEGAVAEALGDAPGALTAYERILSEFPQAPGAPAAAHAMLALRAKAGAPADFLRAWVRAAGRLTPEARAALEPFRLDAAIRAKDAPQARAAAAWLMENAPAEQAADAGYRLGWFERQSGADAQAGETWLRTAERWPGAPAAGRAAYAAAYAFTQARDADRAERALALALASGDAGVAADALLLRARNALAENDAAGAAASLDEYLARFPRGQGAAEAAYLRGLLFFNARDFQAAEGLLAQALAADGADGAAPLDHTRRTDAAMRRAQSLHALGRGDEAAALLQPIVALKDAQGLAPAYLAWLAEFRAGRGEWAQSEAAARALAGRGGEARAWGNVLLGRAAEAQGRRATALAAYEAALAAGGGAHGASAALGVGRLRAAGGEQEAAREAFALAAERADTATAEGQAARAQAYAGLAAACAALGDADGALRANMALIIFFDDEALVPGAFRAAIATLEAQGLAGEAKALREEFAQRYPEAAKE